MSTEAVEHPPPTTGPFVVTTPGIYDMPDDDYHDDPVPAGSLSSSGARKLLPPNCPALYRESLLYPQAHKPTFDFGKAAHKLVLGSGPELRPIGAPDWRTKAAREARDQAHADGAVPILEDDYAHVLGMANALRAHPLAGALFNPDHGRAEQSLPDYDPVLRFPEHVWRPVVERAGAWT